MDSFRESMDSFRIVVTNPDSKKIRFVSWLTNPDSFRIVDHESFMFSKDSYRGFVSWIRFWKIRFVDSFRTNQNLKLLVSFRFVRIRIRIPHPYQLPLKFTLSFVDRLRRVAKLQVFFQFLCRFVSDQLDSIVKSLSYWPSEELVYSTTGCKRVGQKVDFIIEDEEEEKMMPKNIPRKHKQEDNSLYMAV